MLYIFIPYINCQIRFCHFSLCFLVQIGKSNLGRAINNEHRPLLCSKPLMLFLVIPWSAWLVACVHFKPLRLPALPILCGKPNIFVLVKWCEMVYISFGQSTDKPYQPQCWGTEGPCLGLCCPRIAAHFKSL